MLAAAGDEDELLDSGFARFFDAVLDHRFVNHGQHFFRNGLGCGEEARAHACHGKNGFTDLLLGHERSGSFAPKRQVAADGSVLGTDR